MTAAEFEAKRGELGLSRKELANAFEVTYTAVYYWETGQRDLPRLAVLALKGLELEIRGEGTG